MPSDIYRALYVEEDEDGLYTRRVAELPLDGLTSGNVLIEVHYSSLNYKDALSAYGNRGVTRRYPHTPGIDAAGIVVTSESERFQRGDVVLTMGHDLGTNSPGGLAEYVRVPEDWVVPMPEGLTPREAMMYGTAGYTAGQCVQKLLQHGLQPGQDEVVLSGASGGVGSIAAAILAHLGYVVSVVTGKPDLEDYFSALGAKEVIDRRVFLEDAKKPLLGGRWAGGVDAVGGEVLSVMLRSVRRRGAVTACGNAAGAEFTTNVFPFILRGITLYGIDSAASPEEERQEIWKMLAGPWKPDALETLTREITLDETPALLGEMIDGLSRGHTLVRIRENQTSG